VGLLHRIVKYTLNSTRLGDDKLAFAVKVGRPYTPECLPVVPAETVTRQGSRLGLFRGALRQAKLEMGARGEAMGEQVTCHDEEQ